MQRASQLAYANTLIRFIGYKPQPGISDEQFIAAWRAVAEQVPQPGGLVYRELCRQVPEWNKQVAQEIQNANPYDFVDYTIFRPDQNPAEFQVLPDDLASQYEQVGGIFSIIDPIVKPELQGTPETILLNLFEIDGAFVEQGFILGWPTRGQHQAQQAGFFSAMLHRRTQPETQIAAFNRAEWLDMEAYARTISEFDQQFSQQSRMGGAQPSQSRSPVRSYLGLYRIIVALQGKPLADQPRMKAVVMHGYGGPEVLTYQETTRPVPGPGQLLLKVQAVGLNALDLKMRSGDVKTLHPVWPEDILGYDISGVIEALGPGVSDRYIGEEVYGADTPFIRRGYAEYVVVPARLFRPKAKNLSFVEAAAIPSVVNTAQNVLFTLANLQAGQRVLIHGGSGAVGGFAVQLAKRAGAYVIATASTARKAYVQHLGADEVIDYQKQRFEELASNIDVVLDSVGGETRERSWDVMKRGGILITLVPPMPDAEKAAKRGVRAMMNQNADSENNFLSQVTEMIEKGELQVPEIALVLPLAEAQKAHIQLEQRKVQGRVVLQVHE